MSLLVGGKHVVRRGDLGAYVLEDIEAQLEHLVEVLILNASWQWLLVHLISLRVTWMTFSFDYWSLFVIVAIFAGCAWARTCSQLLYPELGSQHQTPDRLQDQWESLREMLVSHDLDDLEEAAVGLEADLTGVRAILQIEGQVGLG